MDLFHDFKLFNESIAIIDQDGNSYSYRDLDDIIRKLVNYIPKGKKSLLLIKTTNTIEALVGYLGGVSSGNTVLLVDSSINDELFENILNTYLPEYIWQPISDCEQRIFRFLNYELLVTNYRTSSPIYPQLSLVMLTSGSTGSPKGVRLTRDNLNANAKSISEYLMLDDSERAITSLPMSYVYGLSVINSHLFVGASILLTDYSLVQKEFWDLFKKYNATSLNGVPYTYEMLKTLHFFNMKLTSLRYLTQAGGKLSEELVAEFAQYLRNNNIKFYVMYGQTEATARISYLPPEFNLIKSKSIGISIPRGKLYLKDSCGNIITTPQTEGMLYYEGPNVMLGYAHGREDLAKEDEQKGILNTNDMAYFDEDGFFYITGRNSRFIKILGKRINLDEMEHYLQKNGFNCVCGGYDDLLLIAVTNVALSQEIKTFAMKKFKIDYQNVDVIHVEKIEKNPSGKIKYDKIFAEFKAVTPNV